MPKTAAERSREYRQRKNAIRIKIKKSPKSSTERVREFRERRKNLKNNPNECYMNEHVSSVLNSTEKLKNGALLNIEHQQFMDLYCNYAEDQEQPEVKQEKTFLSQKACSNLMDTNVINEQLKEKLKIIKTTQNTDNSEVTNHSKPKKSISLPGRKALKDKAWPTIEIKPIDIYDSDADNKEQYKAEECNIKQENVFVDEEDDSCNDSIDVYVKIDEDSEDPLLIRIENDALIDDQKTNARKQFRDIRYNVKKKSFLPPSWLYVDTPNGIAFMRVDLKSRRIVNHLRLNVDGTVTLIFSDNEELQLNEKINSFSSIYDYLKSAEEWPICAGTQIENNEYSKGCKGLLYGDNTFHVRYEAYPRCRPCRTLLNSLQRRNLNPNNLNKGPVRKSCGKL